MKKAGRCGLVTMLAVVVGVAACERKPAPGNTERTYSTRGIVRSVAPDRSTVDIEHEDIPGFMPSMTMPFSVRNPKDIADLHVGDAISFRIVSTDKDLFLDRVQRVNRAEVRVPEPTPMRQPVSSDSPRLREGDNLPHFSLTDQNGGNVSEESFRGHPLVLTFIFTRCAVPNYCPLMSGNFVEIQKAIQAGEIPNARLLSVTLDPAFDTPPVLKQYGDSLKANPAIWTLATGDVDRLVQAFSVYRQTEAGTLSHGLATALVDAHGRIVKIWRGNAWMPSEVVEAVRAQL